MRLQTVLKEYHSSLCSDDRQLAVAMLEYERTLAQRDQR
jgi:hypothetical protein